MVLTPSAKRSRTGSGRAPRSISLVLWKKCRIETPTPRATSGRKLCTCTSRCGPPTTMASVSAWGFLANALTGPPSGSCLHCRLLGAACGRSDPRRRAHDPLLVATRLEVAVDRERHEGEEQAGHDGLGRIEYDFDRAHSHRSEAVEAEHDATSQQDVRQRGRQEHTPPQPHQLIVAEAR